MDDRQKFIEEVSLVNSDIILHDSMIDIYLKFKLKNEYVLRAYNNLHAYDFKDNMNREDAILIFTNKRAYYLRTYEHDSYIDYHKINFINSEIESPTVDKNGLIFTSFGRNSDHFNSLEDMDFINMSFFTYYDNAKNIIDDLTHISTTINDNLDVKLEPLSNRNQSILTSINVNKKYFERINKNDFSKNVYKSMLDDKQITDEQYELLIR